MPNDRYNVPKSLDAPADNFFPVTPHASNELVQLPRALWIGTGGNLNVVDRDGVTALFKNIPNGTLLPIRANKVLVTNTTATDIVGLV